MDLKRKFSDNKILSEIQIKESIFRARNEVALVLKTMEDIQEFHDTMPETSEGGSVKAFEKSLKNHQRLNPINSSVGLASFSLMNNNELPLFHRAAIGLNYLAGEYGYNENQALGKRFSKDPFRFLEFNSYDTQYIDGFKKAAVGVLGACLLHAQKVNDRFLAEDIEKDISKISFDDENASANPPKRFANKRVLAEEEAVFEANKKLLEQDETARPFDMRPDWVARMGGCVANVSSLRVTSEARRLISKPKP